MHTATIVISAFASLVIQRATDCCYVLPLVKEAHNVSAMLRFQSPHEIDIGVEPDTANPLLPRLAERTRKATSNVRRNLDHFSSL